MGFSREYQTNLFQVMLMHSLCTAVCPYAFYTVALDHMEAGKASILCSCEPVAAMVFGFFFLGQYRIILSADTASEVRQMLSQKRR